tara:strand:- start:81 stop:1196 length:1116 start_codon:yes stop_codon:yes gene_type:complete
MNVNYKIDKNDIIGKFKHYIDNRPNNDRDNYNSKGKEVQYRSAYNTLGKIKSVYMYVINLVKLDIRREFIHDDEAFKKALGLLITRVNNKIRSRSDGSIFLKVGVEKPIVFTGDEDEYEEWLVNNKTKQTQVVRKISEELNSVLAGEEIEEEGKTIINDTDLPPAKKTMTSEEIAVKIMESIPSEYTLELFTGKYDNFDKHYNIFIKENKIDLGLAGQLLGRLHMMCIQNEQFNKNIEEALADGQPNKDDNKKDTQDKPQSTSDVGSTTDDAQEKKRKQSMKTLRDRGLEASGGAWQNAAGKTVAKIDDNGNIKYNTDDSDSEGSGGQSAIQQAAADITSQQDDGEEKEDEPEVETGLDNKELETLRKTFD